LFEIPHVHACDLEPRINVQSRTISNFAVRAYAKVKQDKENIKRLKLDGGQVYGR
jgi:hypothetical protein